MTFMKNIGGAVALLAFACAQTIVAHAIGSVTTEPRPLASFRRPPAFDARHEPTIDNDPVWRLGRRLFFEPRLSASTTMSCGSCHQPDTAWSDHRPKAIGDAHKPLGFRAPTLLNANQLDRYGWTGRFPDVATVAVFAMRSPANMNVSPPVLLRRLTSDPTYIVAFKTAFPDGAVSEHNVGTALSRYVRSITSNIAPFDRWIAGDPTAIDAAARRGFAIFNGKGRCSQCHSGWALTDGSFHDIGLPGDDRGRGVLFKTSTELQYAFKTPTLRNLSERSPYMHDGSLPTLEAVVDHYDKGGIDRESRAAAVGPLHLSAAEKQDLVAFLRTLTGPTTFVAPGAD